MVLWFQLKCGACPGAHAAIKYECKGVITLSWGSNTTYYCITPTGATLLGLQGRDVLSFTPIPTVLGRCPLPGGLNAETCKRWEDLDGLTSVLVQELEASLL